MGERDFYNTIENSGYAEFKDRGSKFLAYSFPVADVSAFKKKLQELKDEHPKAAHYCYAYRIGIDGNNFRSSDDGEPSGTAGKPILGQIDSKQLINIGVIVVRYFGGTLLGVPGLINAYKTAASFALQTTTLVQKPVEIKYRIQFDYTRMNEVMMIIKKYNCKIFSQQSDLFCKMEIGIPKSNIEYIVMKLDEVKGIEMEVIS